MKNGVKMFAAVVLACTLISVGVCTIAGRYILKSVRKEIPAVPNPVIVGKEYPDLTYAAENAVKSVVYVKVKIEEKAETDPILRFFFGNDRPRSATASGSGVIISEDGYIVTNNHVIADASKIEVTLNDDKTYKAELVGTDPVTDVAIIKINAKNLPALEMGDSDKLRLGEWVLAIGSPLGYELHGTITSGIVSAKGRSMPSDSREFKIESFIQTDAAVNKGNSGGALVDKSGKLVGINTAIVSPTGAFSGYSFAVPVNIVKRVSEDLIDFGTVKRAMLGVEMITNTEEIAEQMKQKFINGVYISAVVEGSAAAKAGIRKGDVIVSINSEDTFTARSIQEKVCNYHPGDKAKIIFYRNGDKKEVEVTFSGENDLKQSVSFYGSFLRKAPAEKLKKWGLSSGVEIVSVERGKMRDAGAEKGFIILYVNDEPVATAEDVINIAKQSKRAVYIQGVTKSGEEAFFGFAK